MELGGGSSEKRNDETRTEASSLHVTKQEYCRLAQFHACMHVRDRAAGAGCWAYSAATRVGDDEESVGGWEYPAGRACLASTDRSGSRLTHGFTYFIMRIQ